MSDELTLEFQDLLLKAALQDRSFLGQYRDCLDPSYIQNPDRAEVLKTALQYYDDFGGSISHQAMTQFLADNNKEELIELVDDLWTGEISDISYIKKRISDFAKKRAVAEILYNVNDLVKAGEYEEAEEMFLNAIHVGDGRPVQKEFFKTAKERISSYRENNTADRVPTGVDFIDSRIDGGLSRGELAIIMGDTGVGKTHFLVNIAKNAVLSNFKCVYYTLEVSAKKLARRFDMSFTGMTKNCLIRRPNKAWLKMLNLVEKIKENMLFIHQYSQFSLTVNKLAAHLRLLQDKDGFFPDLIIVDYGDLMASDRKYQEYRHELAAIFGGLRSIAVDMNVGCWTATQANREGAKTVFSGGVIDKTHSREGYDKMAIPDVVITLNQTLQEKRSGIMRLFFTKNRDDEDGDTGLVTVDWSRSQIMDFIDDEDG